MQDDVFSTRTVVAVFVALGLFAALVFGLVIVYTGHHNSAGSSASSARHPSQQGSIAGGQSHPAPTVLPVVNGQVNWIAAIAPVEVILAEGTDTVAVLTEKRPSAAQFSSACSKLTLQSVPVAPSGSSGSQVSALQAVESDDAALIRDCDTAISDARSRPANAAPDGKNLGYDVVSLRRDANQFFLAVGFAASKPSASHPSAWTLAHDIGFQQTDFPAGTSAVPGLTGGPDQTTPNLVPSPCGPVHSQPFVADYDSPTYDPSGVGNDFVSSEVLIMPPADAIRALHAIGAPGYDTACFQPAFDANSRSMTPTNSCGSFQFISSSITQLTPTGLPSGSVVDRYEATLSCTTSRLTGTWYTDVISAQAGSAFMQGTFNSYKTPLSAQTEHGAMNAMAARAKALSAGSA